MIGQEDSEQVQFFWVKLPTQVAGSSQVKGGPVKGGSQLNDKVHEPSEWTGLISLQSKGLSRVFSNTTVQKHQFFSQDALPLATRMET